MEKKGGPGPKQRFAEIEGRLKSGSYNSPTRKANRNYLQKYLKDRGEAGSGAVVARKAAASDLLTRVEAFKAAPGPGPKQKYGKTVKVKRAANATNAPSPTGAVMAVSPAKPKPVPAKRGVTKKKVKSKTPPPPVRPKTPPPKASDLYKQVDVEGDGNCYYRALYRAAAEHEDPKILDRVFTILGADKKKMGSEETGQAALRAAIAAYYRTKFLTKDGPYEMLATNYGTIQFKLWAREATGLQAKLYRKILSYVSAKDGKAKFYSDLADIIGTNEEYASEIDYFVISDILDAGGVKIVSTQTSPKAGIFDGKPALYIKRLSYDHYNYWEIKKPRAAAPEPVPAKPKPKPKPNSVSSNNSTNNDSDEERRGELMEELEKRMDKHTRCIEKCKAYGKKVDATKAALKALGK